MNLKTQTIQTYNTSAKELAKKFDSQGSRTEDIEYAFSLVGKDNPFVLEIGCGNGRDAEEICKRTTRYLGMDISQGLLALAQERLPDQQFTLADVEDYVFPEHIDIVFAFASLIHVSKESFKKIMEALYDSAEEKGIIFISLKHSEKYKQVTKTDEYGVRTYWHYSPEDMQEVASGFSIIRTSIQDVRGQIWMDVVFQKK